MSKNKQSTTIGLDDGREVCLSYGAPVAAFIPGQGYVKTDRKYSATTSRHVNQYAPSAKAIPHETFLRLISPISPRKGD